MKVFADLHLHSKYARATSSQMDIENLSKFAKIKGLNLISCGDFTHPDQLADIKQKLQPIEGTGLYQYNGMNFMLTTEMATFYYQGRKPRRVHHIVHVPSIEIIGQIIDVLSKKGANTGIDGRMAMKISSPDLVEALMQISKDIEIVPAHLWTPFFGCLGSKTGFDSVKECYEEQTKNIHAIETGLSSDSVMNWRLSELDDFTLMSNSDSHCIHPDTFIYTNDGVFKIKELKNRHSIKSIDFSNNMKTIKSNVFKIHKKKAPKQLFKIKTRSGIIKVTPEHRFFVFENENIIEKHAIDLRERDIIAVARNMRYISKNHKFNDLNANRYFKLSRKGLKFIKNKRNGRELTQKELGKKLGLYKDHYWKIENGIIKCRDAILKNICELLDIDYSEMEKFVEKIYPQIKYPKEPNEGLYQFLGYLLGDGSIEKNNKCRQVSITDKNRKTLFFYSKIVNDNFGIHGTPKKKRGNSERLIFSAYLLKFIESIDNQFLTYSNKRRIPPMIFSSKKNLVASFLKGLFDAEGSVGDHYIDICSSSEYLIRSVHALLLRFGITSYIYFNLYEKTKKKYRHRLYIYGQDNIKKFERYIGFSHENKNRKLNYMLLSFREKAKESFTDYLPFDNSIKKILDKFGISNKKISKVLKYHLSYSKSSSLRRRHVNEFLILMKKEGINNSIIEKMRKHTNSDIIWEPIVEIEKISSDCSFVYDITVPLYENYIANGIIVHNSPWPWRLGRECNVFDLKKITYWELWDAVRKKDKDRFIYTTEVDPNYGKYHFDGHRNCKVSLHPKETRKLNGICPVCRRPLTIGVLSRVEELADRPEDFVPKDAIPCKTLLPLYEIISHATGTKTLYSKKAMKEQDKLISAFGNELNILLDVPREELVKHTSEKIANSIILSREGKIKYKPGYDGVYGVPVFNNFNDKVEKKGKLTSQKGLFDFTQGS